MLAHRLFTAKNPFEKAFDGVQDLFIDVTEIPVERPENKAVQQEWYSGKKIPYLKIVVNLRPVSAHFIYKQGV